VEQQQAAMSDQKDTMQTTEEFLKAIDKKIAKAGDFWSAEGFTLESYKSYRAAPDTMLSGSMAQRADSRHRRTSKARRI